LVARRIIHQDVKLPEPTSDLLRSCAKAGYLALVTGMAVRFDTDFTDWDSLKKQYQEVWEQSARAMYAVIAIQGGALVEEIPTNGKEPDQ
jgi:hypothetical protein